MAKSSTNASCHGPCDEHLRYNWRACFPGTNFELELTGGRLKATDGPEKRQNSTIRQDPRTLSPAEAQLILQDVLPRALHASLPPWSLRDQRMLLRRLLGARGAYGQPHSLSHCLGTILKVFVHLFSAGGPRLRGLYAGQGKSHQ